MHHRYYCGRRLSYEGNTCTIRYVGPVQGTKGEWLGVEWDDPARGKHNGQHGDVKYFECSSSSHTPASFIRPSRAHDAPRSFVEALRVKYASENLTDAEAQKQVAESVITISGKDVEEVGFDKIRRQLADLQALRIVVLDGLCIGHQGMFVDGGDESTLTNGTARIAEGAALTCPNIVDLDLSRNLFESWQEIFSIVKQLSNLSGLNIGGNRLSNFDTGRHNELLQEPPFSTLKTLGLEHCLLAWKDIADISSQFPNVTSLALGNNELRQLDGSSLPLYLTHISLERNMFEYVSELMPLMKVEHLQRLSLKANRICAVHDPSGLENNEREKLVFPQSLKDLDLSYNEISSWHLIDELANIFPGLTSLRTSANPLFDRLENSKDGKQNAGEGYVLTIARLARLENLNFSKITPKDRRDAEAFYLSQIGKELSSHAADQACKIIARHPRYNELCATLGEPVIARTKTSLTDQTSLTARLIYFTFEANATVIQSARSSSVAQVTDPWKIGIPESFTVYNVLGIVAKHFGLQPMLLKLVWETGEEETLGEVDAVSDPNLTLERKSTKRLREEVLVPRTRRIGTWFETRTAKVRIELSEEDIKRRQAAESALSTAASEKRSETPV